MIRLNLAKLSFWHFRIIDLTLDIVLHLLIKDFLLEIFLFLQIVFIKHSVNLLKLALYLISLALSSLESPLKLIKMTIQGN